MTDLMQKIRDRTAKVAVIGLGYVGLPLAVEAAKAGYQVYGIDIDQAKIDQLHRGQSYVSDIAHKDIEAVIHERLHAVNGFASLVETDVIIICLPTPLNKTKDPDVSYIRSAVDHIIRHMSPDTLVVLESTTYPGTTEELIRKVIEEARHWEAGRDFYVCYSPERIDPGNPVFNVKNTPKVVGGATHACAELGAQFYRSFLEKVIPVSSTAVAEMVKLLENTFRSVNIGLVNELTLMCDRMGINVWEVIAAASTKPFGYTPFYPGPGIGGHCIPIDPMYLSWKAKMYGFNNKFIELASEINGSMPRYVVSQIADILNDNGKPVKNSRVLCIGMAYKKDVNDMRESPALEVFRLLERKGAAVAYHDPHIPSFANDDRQIMSVELTPGIVASADLVVITTNHSAIDYELVAEHAPLLYDTRNVIGSRRGDTVLLGGRARRDTASFGDAPLPEPLEGLIDLD